MHEVDELGLATTGRNKLFVVSGNYRNLLTQRIGPDHSVR